MFDFKNCVMKIMSKSLSRPLVRLQGKLKLKKKNICIHKFLLYFSVFHCTSYQVISVANLR
jgi:hypothetical protein